MRESNPLIQTWFNTTCKDEEEVVGDVWMSLQEGTSYARVLYETGEAAGLLSPDCYRALKQALEDEDRARRSDPTELEKAMKAVRARKEKRKRINRYRPLKITRKPRGAKLIDWDEVDEEVTSNKIGGEDLENTSKKGKSPACSEDSTQCSRVEDEMIRDDPVMVEWMKMNGGVHYDNGRSG